MALPLDRRVIRGQQGREPREPPTLWELPHDIWPLLHTMGDAPEPAKLKPHTLLAEESTGGRGLCRNDDGV